MDKEKKATILKVGLLSLVAAVGATVLVLNRKKKTQKKQQGPSKSGQLWAFACGIASKPQIIGAVQRAKSCASARARATYVLKTLLLTSLWFVRDYPEIKFEGEVQQLQSQPCLERTARVRCLQ